MSVWMHNGIAVIEIKVEEPAILEELADMYPHTIYFEAEFETVTHTEDTVMKVAESLRESGIPLKEIPDIVSAMQNRGILFRERA